MCEGQADCGCQAGWDHDEGGVSLQRRKSHNSRLPASNSFLNDVSVLVNLAGMMKDDCKCVRVRLIVVAKLVGTMMREFHDCKE